MSFCDEGRKTYNSRMKISEKSNPSTKTTTTKNVHRPVVTTIRDDDLTD